MEPYLAFNTKRVTGYVHWEGCIYDFEVTTLPRIRKRQAYGLDSVGGYLVKFAQVAGHQFFSFEVRFVSQALAGYGIKSTEDLKRASVEVAVKTLENHVRDDRIITVGAGGTPISAAPDLPLQKHRFYHHTREEMLA